MEIWDLIDENGNKIGKTHIRGEEIPKGFYHLGVDIWIMNSKKEFLIQKRSLLKKSYPGIWAMTGGSALSGETSLEAIKRETFEELGIQINEENLKLVNKIKGKHTLIDVYLLKQDIPINEINIQNEEVSDVKWASYEEIEKLVNKKEFLEERWNSIKESFDNGGV